MMQEEQKPNKHRDSADESRPLLPRRMMIAITLLGVVATVLAIIADGSTIFDRFWSLPTPQSSPTTISETVERRSEENPGSIVLVEPTKKLQLPTVTLIPTETAPPTLPPPTPTETPEQEPATDVVETDDRDTPQSIADQPTRIQVTEFGEPSETADNQTFKRQTALRAAEIRAIRKLKQWAGDANISGVTVLEGSRLMTDTIQIILREQAAPPHKIIEESYDEETEIATVTIELVVSE